MPVLPKPSTGGYFFTQLIKGKKPYWIGAVKNGGQRYKSNSFEDERGAAHAVDK